LYEKVWTFQKIEIGKDREAEKGRKYKEILRRNGDEYKGI